MCLTNAESCCQAIWWTSCRQRGSQDRLTVAEYPFIILFMSCKQSPDSSTKRIRPNKPGMTTCRHMLNRNTNLPVTKAKKRCGGTLEIQDPLFQFFLARDLPSLQIRLHGGME